MPFFALKTMPNDFLRKLEEKFFSGPGVPSRPFGVPGGPWGPKWLPSCEMWHISHRNSLQLHMKVFLTKKGKGRLMSNKSINVNDLSLECKTKLGKNFGSLYLCHLTYISPLFFWKCKSYSLS